MSLDSDTLWSIEDRNVMRFVITFGFSSSPIFSCDVEQPKCVALSLSLFLVGLERGVLNLAFWLCWVVYIIYTDEIEMRWSLKGRYIS